MPAKKEISVSDFASSCESKAESKAESELTNSELAESKLAESKFDSDNLAPQATGSQPYSQPSSQPSSQSLGSDRGPDARPEFTLLNPPLNIEQDIEQAIAALTTGDFPSKWDHARAFGKRFAHWGDRPIPHLIQHLQSSPNVENQWFLIRTLGQFKHPSVVEALASFLVNTPEKELQIEATKALTGLGSCAIAALTLLITSPLTERRKLAAGTLAKIRRSAVIEPLLSVVNDPDEQLRGIAIEALGSFHDPRITPVLLKAVHDTTAIAIEAIRTLGRRSDLLATTDVIALLQACLLGDDADIARESAIALGRLGAHPGGEPAAQALGQFLTGSAPSPVKVVAARALGWLEAPEATVHLATAFESPFPLVMPEVRQEIARSLGQTRLAELQPIAAKPLVAWLESQSSVQPQIQAQMQTQMQTQMQNQAQTHQLSIDILALKQAVLSALARLGVIDTISSLIPSLGDPDARIRMHALNALKQIDPNMAQAKVANYLSTEPLPFALQEKIAHSLSAW
jgi:HEAT repeat protein